MFPSSLLLLLFFVFYWNLIKVSLDHNVQFKVCNTNIIVMHRSLVSGLKPKYCYAKCSCIERKCVKTTEYYCCWYFWYSKFVRCFYSAFEDYYWNNLYKIFILELNLFIVFCCAIRTFIGLVLYPFMITSQTSLHILKEYI